MKITDEIVYKALNEFHAVRFASISSDTRKVRREAMRAALTAALSSAEKKAVKVAVKPLTWRAYGNQHLKGWQGVGRMGYLAYVTNTGPDGETGWFFDNDQQFDTADDAKAAAQQDYETRIRSALVDVPAVESEPVGEPEASAMRVIDADQWEPCSPSWLERGGDCKHAPRVWNAAKRNHWHPKLYAHPPRSSLIQSEEGKITLTVKEAEKLAARLEFDAAWDKCGDGYYSIKNQLRALSTPPSPYGGDNGDGAATSTKGQADE